MNNFFDKYPYLKEVVWDGNFIIFYNLVKDKYNLSFNKAINLFNNFREYDGLEPVEIINDFDEMSDDTDIQIIEPELDEEFIEKNINKDKVVVVKHNDDNFGEFVVANKSLSKGQNDLFILELEVYPKYRNLGYFKYLMDEIIKYAESTNKDRIVLDVDISKGSENTKKLIDLYTKYGFTPGEDDLYYKELDKKTTEEAINNAFKNIFEITSKKKSYTDKVFDILLDLFLDKNNIGEKDFKKYKEYRPIFDTVIENNRDKYSKYINVFEKTKKRDKYCAEYLFDKFSDDFLNKKREYGCLMVHLDVDNWSKFTDIIKPEDVYNKNGLGLENQPHTTILYGFKEKYGLDDIKNWFKSFSSPIKIEILGISIFENPEFDVVKLDVKSDVLNSLNKIFRKLPVEIQFPDYHPHITIAYCKKGTGKKYIKSFEESYIIYGKKLELSNVDGNDFFYTIGENLEERVKRYMPGSLGVKIKKKCKLGGNPDGTSDQCEKGNISNLDLTTIDEDITRILNILETKGITIKDLANKIANRLNFKIVRKLGYGTMGMAFEISGNKVMKITDDEGEALEANKILNKDNNYLGNVYNIYKLNNDYNGIYIIIRELLTVDKNYNEDFILNTLHYQAFLRKLSNFGNFRYSFLLSGEYTIDEYLKEFNNSPERFKENKFVIQMNNIIMDLHKNGIKSFDNTEGNFGFKPNGNLAYYDLGYSFDENSFNKNDIKNIEINDSVAIDEYSTTLYRKNIDPKSIADQIASKLGFKIVTRLGKGWYGFAFLTSDDKVLKITTDKSEAGSAAELVGIKNRFLADYYTVYSIQKNVDGVNIYDNIYAILLEKLDIIEYDEGNDLINSFEDFVMKTYKPRASKKHILNQPSDIIKAKTGGLFFDFKNFVENFNFNDNNVLKENVLKILNIMTELVEKGIKSTDFLNPLNLGYKGNGNLAYFDIGISNKYPENVDTMEVESVDLSQNKIMGGKSDNKSIVNYNLDELLKGIEIEMEHTNDKSLAAEIAKDHLEEIPDYYSRLSKMEKNAES